MPGLRIMCSICTEDFEEADDVYSTSCGHIYHFSCMRQWQSRATSCPQCRSHNPECHKIFLIFNEDSTDETERSASVPVDIAAENQDLQDKLENSVKEITALNVQLKESQLNVQQLQEQLDKLELRIALLSEDDADFLKLHALYSESEDRVKILKEENECLALDNEFKTKELDNKTNELSILKNLIDLIDGDQSNRSKSAVHCSKE